MTPPEESPQEEIMGALEYVFWLSLMLPPPETMARPWLFIVAVVIMFWYWYIRLPQI